MSATSAGYLVGVRRTPTPEIDESTTPYYVDFDGVSDPKLTLVDSPTAVPIGEAKMLGGTTAKAKAVKDAAANARSGALGSLVALIPSEALAIYIAGLAWVAAFNITKVERDTALAVIMIAAGLFSGILTARTYYLGAKAVDPTTTPSVLRDWEFIVLLLITEGAFVLYALAMTDSPFGWNPLWTGLAAIVVTPVLVLFASWLNRTPAAIETT